MLSLQLTLQQNDFSLSLDITIPGKGITTIFGPSGSGKTQILRCIAGLEKKARGSIRYQDSDWLRSSHNIFIPAHERHIAYVFQEANLFPHLNVMQNLEYGMKRSKHKTANIHRDDIINWMGIKPLLRRNPQTLSGGERQRVAIARALLSSPQLLLMDEPLASLDEKSRNEILHCLEHLHQHLDIPILYVTHSLNELYRLSDYIMLVEEGRCSAHGPVHEILDQMELAINQLANTSSLIEGHINHYDEQYKLTYIDSIAGTFALPGLIKNKGALRIRIMAKDVAIALEKPVKTSIINYIEGIVNEIHEYNEAQNTIKILANKQTILARITKKSCDHLQLKPRTRIFALIKSVALNQ